MATISKISVDFEARTVQFRTEMSKGEKQLASFRRQANSARNMLLGLGAALGAGFAVHSLVNLTKQSMASVDQLKKLSDRLGETTEKMAGLKHAADLAGGAQAIDQGIEQMVRRIGQGTTETVKAIDSLGLSTAQLQAMSPVDAFGAIADEINKIPDATGRAAAAYSIFGRQGQTLLNTMAIGSEGIRQATDEAVKLGIAVSSFDASQIEAANDAITRMDRSIEGVGTQLAVELAPWITSSADRFVEWATSGTGAAAKVSGAVETVGIAIGHTLDVLDVGVGIVKGAQSAVLGVTAAAAKGIELVGRGMTYLIRLIPGVDEAFSSTFEALDGYAKGAMLDMERLRAEMDEIQNRDFSDQAHQAFQKLKTDAREAADAMEEAAQQKRAMQAAMAEFASGGAVALPPPPPGITRPEALSVPVNFALPDRPDLSGLGGALPAFTAPELPDLSGTEIPAPTIAEPELPDLSKIIVDLEKQAAAAGRTGNALKLYQLDVAGASDAVKEYAQSLIQAEENNRGFAEARKSIQDLSTDLQRQIAVAGKSSEEAAIWSAEQKLAAVSAKGLTGATADLTEATADLAKARELLAQRDAAVESRKLRDATDELTRSLKDQIAMYGLASRQAEAYAIKMKGLGELKVFDSLGFLKGPLLGNLVPDNTLDMLNATLDALDKFTDLDTSNISEAFVELQQDVDGLIGLLNSGKIELPTFENAVAKLEKDFTSTVGSRAKQLIESTQTPLEKYGQQIEEIALLAANGFLDIEHATRASTAALAQLKQSAKGGNLDLASLLPKPPKTVREQRVDLRQELSSASDARAVAQQRVRDARRIADPDDRRKAMAEATERFKAADVAAQTANRAYFDSLKPGFKGIEQPADLRGPGQLATIPDPARVGAREATEGVTQGGRAEAVSGETEEVRLLRQIRDAITRPPRPWTPPGGPPEEPALAF